MEFLYHEPVEYAPLIALLFATGIVAGVLAGLLGIGGGIVIVPIMEWLLGYLGVDASIRMHIAVATSLAVIIPTSIASTRAHARRQSVDFNLVRRWGVFILIGSLVGTLAAAQVHSRVLAMVFGSLALVIAIKMLLPERDKPLAENLPQGLASNSIPTGIGFFSSMMGIGGGTFTVAVMTLCNQPIHRAIGTAALFGLLISLPGTLGFLFTGWNNSLLPMGSVGFVNWIAFLLIAPGTVMAAPWGAALAHRLDKRRLGFVFAVLLILLALRMFSRAAG